MRQEEKRAKSKDPVAALNIMVTIPGELNMDHLKLHLMSETGKKMEKKWNNRIRSNREDMKRVLWCFMYIKEKTLGEKYKEAYEL